MLKKYKLFNSTQISIIISIIFSIFFSLRVFIEIGSDFAAYLSFAKDILGEKIIYDDFFSHKGPHFIMYLALITKLIGFGQIQAWFILTITLLIFFLSILILCKKFNTPNILMLTIIFGITTSLDGASPNAILDIFLSSLIIGSFISFSNYLDNRKNNYLIMGFIFLSIAALSRIDMIVNYLGILCFFIFSNNKFSLLKLFIVSMILIIIFLITKIGLKFSVNEFINQNFFFNFNYKMDLWGTFLNHFIRKNHFLILVSSSILPIFLFIFFHYLKTKEIKKNFKNTFKLNSQSLSFIYLITGFLIWFAIGSDNNFHFLTIFAPILIFIIVNNKKYLLLNNTVKKIFLLLSIYGFIISSTYGLMIIKNNSECISNLPCKSSKNFNTFTTINKINNLNKDIYVLGGNGLISVLANKKILSNVNNYWFYLNDNFYHKTIYQNYKYLISNKNINFLVDESILHTPKIIDLTNQSVFIEKIGNYYFFKTK